MHDKNKELMADAKTHPSAAELLKKRMAIPEVTDGPTNQEILDELGEDVVQTAMMDDIDEGLAMLAELKSKPMNREERRRMKRRNRSTGLLLALTMIGGVVPTIIHTYTHTHTYNPEPTTEYSSVVEYVNLPENQPLIKIMDESIKEPVFGFTDNDIYLLSQLLAGNEGVYGDGEYDFEWQLLHQEPNDDQISLVLEVVMNRVNDPRWGDTIESVVLQPHQFSVFPKNNGSKPSPLVINYISGWCESYDTGELVKTIPEDHVYFTGDGTNNHSRSVWM